MKVERKTYEQHPEGWFAFCVRSCEPTESEFKGRKTLRFTWSCESSERNSEGAKHNLNVYTGRELVDDERCKLKQFVEACGLDSEEFEDTDEVVGKVFAGKVAHGIGDKAGYANIIAFDTRDRVRPAKAAKKAVVEDQDPFADE